MDQEGMKPPITVDVEEDRPHLPYNEFVDDDILDLGDPSEEELRLDVGAVTDFCQRAAPKAPECPSDWFSVVKKAREEGFRKTLLTLVNLRVTAYSYFGPSCFEDEVQDELDPLLRRYPETVMESNSDTVRRVVEQSEAFRRTLLDLVTLDVEGE